MAAIESSFESLWHFGSVLAAVGHEKRSSSCRAAASSACSLSSACGGGSIRSPSYAATSEGVEEDVLRPLFALVDEDEDGEVSVREMESLLRKVMGRSDVAAESIACLFNDAVASTSQFRGTNLYDNSTGLDFGQFLTLYSSFGVGAAVDQEEDLVACAFRVYDRDGDGFICASELVHVLRELGLVQQACPEAGRRQEEEEEAEALSACQAYLDRVDTDGNGLVDLREFRSMLLPCHA